MKIKLLLLVLAAISFAATVKMHHKIENGKDLIKEMHEKYDGKWYKYLTFEQRTVFFEKGQVSREQTWHEAMELPGKLAIKFDSKNSGNGILFRDGRQYAFSNGKLTNEIPLIHDLLLLGFDVYMQNPEKTIQALKDKGFNMEKLYETEWQGKKVYVAGTDKADDSKHQFWVDKKELLLVRVLNTTSGGNKTEVQFNKYRKVGKGWVAAEVVFNNNGERRVLEEYSNIHSPQSLDAGIFGIESFATASLE